MQWSDEDSPTALAKAFENWEFAEAERIVQVFLDDLEGTRRLVPLETARSVLETLRAQTAFEALGRVAERLIRNGRREPEIRQRLAQSRIEQGEITRAIGGLKKLAGDLERESRRAGLGKKRRKAVETDLGEALGLLGRAYKQLYVNAQPTRDEPRLHDLEQAIGYYRSAYQRGLGSYLWHGVNYLALKNHEVRVAADPEEGNGYATDVFGDASAILKAIPTPRKGRLDAWSLSQRAECYLALGKPREARVAIRAYLESRDLTAFKVRGTRRQLIELWGLDPSVSPGREILPMMTAKLAELGGGRVDLDIGAAEIGRLESVLGEVRYQPLEFLKNALQRAAAVVRLGPDQHVGSGSGFLFDGSWIGKSFAGRKLLLTNAHVCTDKPEVLKRYPDARPPAETRATFLGAGGGDGTMVVGVGEATLWTSPPEQLDATLLEIEDAPASAAPPPKAATLPATRGRRSRVNVIGYPGGQGVKVSLQDNRVMRVGKRYIHYRTPTDPGSSGSPVFDQKWQLVALHHRGKGKDTANEGIVIDRVIEEMRRELS